MKRKSPALALLWLLLIPGQIIIALILFVVGALIDEYVLFGGAANPVPVVTLILSFVAVVASFVVFILAIVLTIVRFNKISKDNKMLENRL